MSEIFLKDHKGLFHTSISPKKESFGLFLLLLQQLILELSSFPSMTFVFASFLETFVKNLSLAEEAEYKDWNFDLITGLTAKKSNSILENSQVSLEEILNEQARKEFKKGQAVAKYWLRLHYLHQTNPSTLVKAFFKNEDMPQFIHNQISENQISPGVNNRVLNELPSDEVIPQKLNPLQLQNPFSNRKVKTAKSKKKQATLEQGNPFDCTRKMLVNLSHFLIFLNKTFFLLVESESLQSCIETNVGGVYSALLPGAETMELKAGQLKDIKRVFEDEIQVYLDSCEVFAFNIFLEKIESFLEIYKKIDRDYLKRVLEFLLFRKFQLLKKKTDTDLTAIHINLRKFLQRAFRVLLLNEFEENIFYIFTLKTRFSHSFETQKSMALNTYLFYYPILEKIKYEKSKIELIFKCKNKKLKAFEGSLKRSEVD